jgi:cell division protease FtsH
MNIFIILLIVPSYSFIGNSFLTNKVYSANSNNGFDFNPSKKNFNYGISERTTELIKQKNFESQQIKRKTYLDKYNYGMSHKTREIFNKKKRIAAGLQEPDENDDDEDLVVIHEKKHVKQPAKRPVKYGYPHQANMNIPLPEDMKKPLFTEKDLEDKTDEELAKTDEELTKALEQQFRQSMGFPIGIRVMKRAPQEDKPNSGSENFEIIKSEFTFDDVGGYENIKQELNQTIDILKNFEKYKKYNVRTPKGLILEGPPGNGKTLLAKAFCGEVNASFIPVSGSQFTEKYVGVGASRIRELFDLAKDNIPCIIFIDEIDALGRSRGNGDGGANSNAETQSTLNQLLVGMDGFNSSEGIFVIGATNRADLLDSALLRPGRIDKKIFLGNPDAKTREKILNIHIDGKPCDDSINMENLIELTNGLSGAQIENLLNEAMLFALRENREVMCEMDLEQILSRMLVGYQSYENIYSDDMINRIAIHELGHAILGILSMDHAKLVKVCLNMWSPSSPGYTLFESAETDSNIYTKEKLTSRLMVLLGGRIAEEVFFGASITSGASKDIEDAYGLAEQMIIKYGMGKKIVNAHYSEKSKDFIDKEIELLINNAYYHAKEIIMKHKEVIQICADELVEKQILLPENIYSKI